MELMSESVGILSILPVNDWDNAAVLKKQTNCMFVSAHLLLIGDEA